VGTSPSHLLARSKSLPCNVKKAAQCLKQWAIPSHS
jgi:hypothetical protein